MTLETDLGPAALAYRAEVCEWLRAHAPAELKAVDVDDALPGQACRLAQWAEDIHRAAPHVPAPYVSAVVELDGGGVIKANLVGIEPDPKVIHLGGRVHLTTFVAGTDDDGTEAVAFGYAPDEQDA